MLSRAHTAPILFAFSRRTIAVNFTATYHAVRAFLPAMLTSGHGHIVRVLGLPSCHDTGVDHRLSFLQVATSSIMGYFCVSQLSACRGSLHPDPRPDIAGDSPLTADYVASKHALVGFLESLRLELDKK